MYFFGCSECWLTQIRSSFYYRNFSVKSRNGVRHEEHEFTSWKTYATCVLAYFRQYCFLWSACHVMFLHKKFLIGMNIYLVIFLQCVWIKPHSSSLTNEENLTRSFGQFVQISCREKKEENNGNCKAFCVTRKSK